MSAATSQTETAGLLIRGAGSAPWQQVPPPVLYESQGSAVGLLRRHVSQPPRWERLHGEWVDRSIAALLFVLTACVYAVGVFGYPALGDDEGTYVSQAWAIRHGEMAHYTYWYDHPPLGWIQLAAVDWLPQLLFPAAHPVAASRSVMVVVWAASAALLYFLARRLGYCRPFAAAASLLCCMSPLTVTLGRQVFLDSIAVPWLLITFILIANRRHHMWLHTLAGGTFAVSVLTKETMLVFLPAVLWALLQHSHPRIRAFSVVGFLGLFTMTGLLYVLFAALRGELIPGEGHVSLIDGVLFQLVNRTESGSVLSAGTGSRATAEGWLALDPWLIVLGLAAAPVALCVARLRPVAVALLFFTAVACKPGGYLPQMFIVTGLPLLALSATGVADAAWQSASRRPHVLRAFVCGLLVTAIGLACAALVPAWSGRLQKEALAAENNTYRLSAERWLAERAGANDVVLSDDVTRMSLVRQGPFRRENAIWFYKLDTDIEVRERFPAGWREIDYLVSTRDFRATVSFYEQSAEASRHSMVVAAFGEGDARVEVRRVIASQ